ncbi:MAG: Fe-S cluster assembly protein SufD [Candidatus Eremiobacteraeota bacterium]|nr:Fe-S cluster assembly protein SufD [Candidatus Eremiobacteraeota bacterium]
MANTSAAPALELSAIEALTAGEASWLREVRHGALERFESIAAPTDRTEGWRRLTLDGIDLSPATSEPSHFTLTLSEADRKRGVVATTIGKALESHEPMVREALLHARSGRTVGKYSALAEAAWQGGAFVHVPDGVEATEPIVARVQTGTYPRLIVVIGKNARASVTESHHETARFVAGLSDLIVGENGHLTYAHAQECGARTIVFSHQHARISSGAKLVTLNLGAGGALAKSDIEVELLGRGAESDMLGLVYARDAQQFDYHTLQGHRATDTRSDLLFKSALDDRAHSVYTGVIVIEKGAQRSDAYQANRNLLLAEGARADTEPKLEIEADDVRCTHGATVGPIDAEQLFYLGSRGMDRDAASRLIVEGFFQDVFDKVGDERLTRDLEAKFAPDLEHEG